MDAVKFVKEYLRMCTKVDECEDCPARTASMSLAGAALSAGSRSASRRTSAPTERERTTRMQPKIILDLCGGTGSWSRPWQLNSYDVRIITLPAYDVLTYEPPDNVWGVLAAPPCTEFSVLNCIAENRKRDFDSGMEIVNACLRIIEQCKPQWWALENPRGHLRDFLGAPKMTFQPWEYGDPWTKATDIWGEFNIPPKLYSKWDDVPNKLPLYQRKGRSKPNFAFLHKSAWKDIPQLAWHDQPTTDAELRAMTPPGFAWAFYEANK